jgi:hypothetical protein
MSWVGVGQTVQQHAISDDLHHPWSRRMVTRLPVKWW